MSKERYNQIIDEVKNFNQFLNENKSKKQLDYEYYAVMW